MPLSTNMISTSYWKANVRIITICLVVVWALCSKWFGIALRPLLAGIQIRHRFGLLVCSARLDSHLHRDYFLLLLENE